MPKPREVHEHVLMPCFLDVYAVTNDSRSDTSAPKRPSTARVVIRPCGKIELVNIDSWYVPRLGRCNLISIQDGERALIEA
jgi:hypothetical protein